MLGKILPQPMVKGTGRLAMHADLFGCHTGGRAGHDVFEQPIALGRPELAILYAHSAA